MIEPRPVVNACTAPGAADDVAAGREVRARDQADQLPELVGAEIGSSSCFEMRVLDQPDAAVDDLAQVVRRDVGRHADGDAGRSVDQQVRKRRRENGRLFGGLVVVRDEVDGLLVEIRHHVVGERFEPRFRVPHRRRRVAVDRSEIALPVHQRVAHVEVLRHADERVVDGGVAVGMEIAHHLADDLRALAIAARGRQPHRLHAVQHAAMRGLQAVAGVGQRSSNDYAHGVIHVRTLHLVFDVDGVQRGYEVGHSWGLGLVACGSCLVASSLRSSLRAGPESPATSHESRVTSLYTSRFFTSSALSSMNFRRGSTWSPISVVNIRSASV